MASVRIEKLCKTFDEKTNVVDDVSVCIPDNEFVVIVGPSGCGKTTTLNIIAGLEKPSSGHIFIDDECVDDVEPKDRNIAMVFQTHTLYPHLSVKDNLAFPLRIRRCDKELIEQRVSSTAEMLGISALLSRKPRQLSGGQMQRVAIGKAIVREPKVFLMDEPLSNLDASLKTQMREELKRIHQKIDSTFIYVTHDQVEAMTLATTLIVMNMGKIQQIGSPYEVFSKPSNLFVSSFIGSFPMNFIECEINDTSDKRKSVCVFGDDIQFTLSQNTLNKLVVGIRAEDLLVDFNSPGEPSEISSYEVLGSNTLLKCKLCNGIFYLSFFSIMIPSSVTLVPLFILLQKLHMLNSLFTVILTSLSLPFLIYLFRQNTKLFPKELVKSSRVDGLSELGIFFFVFIPNMSSVFVTAGIILFIDTWNSLLFPLIIIQSQEKMTLSVYINSIGSSYTSDYGAFMLALSLATLPIILLFIVVQKRFRMGMRGI